MHQPDPHFKSFIRSLEGVIAGLGEENTTARQKAQVEGLVKLEKRFRRALIRHHLGKKVYQKFISYIMDEKRNILEARPFFRERNTVFTSQISDILRNRSHRGLFRFHFNYQFIAFVMKAENWRPRSTISKLYAEIVQARKELIELNLPLAISQARMFWGKMQKSHISYLDFIQIATEGLISAVDKFCLPYSTVFRTVATHRAKGLFIHNFSETSMHFYPKDRRRLYQAYKFIRMQQGKDYQIEDLVKHINSQLKPNEHTDVSEMVSLLNSASVISASSAPVEVDEDDRQQSVMDRYASPRSEQPDIQNEDKEAQCAMYEAIGELRVLDRKLLRMKGVEV